MRETNGPHGVDVQKRLIRGAAAYAFLSVMLMAFPNLRVAKNGRLTLSCPFKRNCILTEQQFLTFAISPNP